MRPSSASARALVLRADTAPRLVSRMRQMLNLRMFAPLLSSAGLPLLRKGSVPVINLAHWTPHSQLEVRIAQHPPSSCS
jgi:hypothetical protein